jgi:hypothetical protein
MIIPPWKSKLELLLLRYQAPMGLHRYGRTKLLLDYRYVINYTLLFVAAKWTLSESGLLTSPTLTHSSTYVVYIEGRDRIAHSTGR